MTRKADVENFLPEKTLAVVGVSRRGNKSLNKFLCSCTPTCIILRRNDRPAGTNAARPRAG